jgi:hypothetical protein
MYGVRPWNVLIWLSIHPVVGHYEHGNKCIIKEGKPFEQLSDYTFLKKGTHTWKNLTLTRIIILRGATVK